MLHRTKSFMSCVSFAAILALGACGGSESRFEQTAQFSQANDDEILAVLTVIDLAQLASLAIPFIAALDAGFGDDNCPQITETAIVGNCVGSDGTRYDGSAEFIPSGVDELYSMRYRQFRYSDENFSVYLDGSVEFSPESDGLVRYDLALTTEVQYRADAEPTRAEAEMSAICELFADGAARCTLEPGSAAKIDGLGGFTMEGTHQIGYSSELGDDNSSEVTAQGADSLHYEYDGATDCYTYTIAGGEPQQSCEE